MPRNKGKIVEMGMYELIGPESYFVYYKEIEYLFGALEKLAPYGVNQNVPKVFGTMKESVSLGKSRWLYEVFQSMNKEYHMGFLEFFIYYDMKNFTLEGYEEYIISLPKEEFLTIYFNGVDKDEIVAALTNGENAQEFFEKHSDMFTQYLAYQYFFNETQKIIRMFFSFVKTLKSEEADQFLDKKQQEIENEKNKLVQALKAKEPFQYSEELMGKNCYNRGPYHTFYFMPSVFFPLLFCRVFGKDQFLFYDYRRLAEKKENVPEQLKAMADNTRYRILLLLNEQKHLTGVEIAKQLHLATSTVSHHMNTLRDSGLVHEEPVGSTKCYSIAKGSMQNCIKVLGDIFLQ
jgi:DNA-binding transcriptional ArsR family regulator